MKLTFWKLLADIWRGWWWYWFRVDEATLIGRPERLALVFYGVPWVTTTAICLGRRIYVHEPVATGQLLAHEYVHVQQYAKYGFWTYLLLWWIHYKRVGYTQIPFELEAFREAASTFGHQAIYGPGDYWPRPPQWRTRRGVDLQGSLPNRL